MLPTQETVTLEADDQGRITTKSQIVDYCQHGEHLEQCNIIDYFVNTYEIDIDSKGDVALTSAAQNGKWQGRPCHLRVRYLSGHLKARTKQRIMRNPNHHTLPNFIGSRFPPHDEPDEYPLYCASMLMLLKPWRQLQKDLKPPKQSWESAFGDFLATATVQTKKILSGIQYYHECRDSTVRHTLSVEMAHALEGMATEDMVVEERDEGGKRRTITEEMLTDLVASQQTSREEWHGLLAIEAAKLAKIFDGSEGEPWREAQEPEGT